MRFTEYLIKEDIEYNVGEVVYLNPMVVGDEGGIGKIVNIDKNKFYVKNELTGNVNVYSSADIRNSDNVPDEWVTSKVEKVQQKL